MNERRGGKPTGVMLRRVAAGEFNFEVQRAMFVNAEVARFVEVGIRNMQRQRGRRAAVSPGSDLLFPRVALTSRIRAE